MDSPTEPVSDRIRIHVLDDCECQADNADGDLHSQPTFG